MSTLRTWLDAAWPRHDQTPRALADELLAMAPTLPDDADGAEAVRLARHVLLAHLHDATTLQRLLDALPAGEHIGVQKERTAWALAALRSGGWPAEPRLPESVTWLLLGDVAQALIHRGDLAAARTRVLGQEAAAAAHADTAARRAYAATAHNVTLALRTGPRDAARDALMIEMAELERRAWARAGGWMEVERADYHLAMCHAVIGQGTQAVAHATACLQACEANGADAAERFFAHECNVHAARAAGDGTAAAAHRARMVALLAEVADAGMKAWCEETLATTPQ
jgi:hypothetical protein